MKKQVIFGCAMMAWALLLNSCASNKLEANVSSDGTKTVIKRWTGMEVGLEARPNWIKDMAIGKQDSFRKEYKNEIGDDEVLPIVITHAPSVDEAEALAFAEVDLEFARSLSTRVNALAGENLSDGQKSAVLQSASVIQADFTGVHKMAAFWMEVESGGSSSVFKKSKAKTEVIYYYVCAVPQNVYETVSKTYLLKLIQSMGLDDETKKTVLSLKDELVKRDAEKNAQQKQREEFAHQEYIESLKTEQIKAQTTKSASEQNLDEALEAAASIYGLVK